MMKENFTLDTDEQVKQISIVCYFTKEQVVTFCFNFCKNYAFIEHDKDTKEDGTPKERHIHLLATFHSKTLVSAILKRLKMCGDDTQTILFKAMLNRRTAFQYLTHTNCPSKTQYKSEDIVTDDVSVWTLSEAELKANENVQFLDDITTLTPLELAKKYGRDYIRNFHKYDEFARMLNNTGKAPIHEELAQNIEQLQQEQLIDFLEYQERRFKRRKPNCTQDDINEFLKDAEEWYIYHRQCGANHTDLKFTNTTLF